jgi:hypothetical protein
MTPAEIMQKFIDPGLQSCGVVDAQTIQFDFKDGSTVYILSDDDLIFSYFRPEVQ